MLHRCVVIFLWPGVAILWPFRKRFNLSDEEMAFAAAFIGSNIWLWSIGSVLLYFGIVRP